MCVLEELLISGLGLDCTLGFMMGTVSDWRDFQCATCWCRAGSAIYTKWYSDKKRMNKLSMFLLVVLLCRSCQLLRSVHKDCKTRQVRLARSISDPSLSQAEARPGAQLPNYHSLRLAKDTEPQLTES